MALARYEGVVVDNAGNIVPLATIEVRRDQPGRPVVPLFSDRSGTVAIGNPIQADALGAFGFHLPGGVYWVRAFTGPQQQPTFEVIKRYVAVGTASERDVEDLAAVLEAGTATYATLPALELFVPAEPGIGGKVTTGPDAGYYHYDDVTDVWVFDRPLYDSVARMTVTGGTADAITASIANNIDASSVVLMILTPDLTNTGPVTVNDIDLLGFDGSPLEAGWIQADTPVQVYEDAEGNYRLALDHRFATLAAQTATARDESVSARDKAEEWAENPEDVAVEGGQFSAKHHAIKAAADAGDASTDAAAALAAKNAAEALYGDLDAVEQAKIDSQTARDVAVAALNNTIITANAVGPVLIVTTKALADAALAGLANLAIVEVVADESRGGLRTRYQKITGAYVFLINLDAVATNGSSFPVPYYTRLGAYLSPLDFEAEAGRVTQSNGTTMTAAIRTAALQVMLNVSPGLGKEVVIPVASEDYETDTCLYMPRTMRTIHLEGILSNVQAVASGDNQSVFKIGNHHPAQWGAFTWFPVDTPIGPTDSFVFTNTGSNRADAAAAIQVGDQVIARSKYYYLGAGSNPDRMRPLFVLLANVLYIDGVSGQIVFDRPIDGIPTGGMLIANAYQPATLDLEGQGVFVASKPRIIGGGGLKSLGSIFARSGVLDGEIRLASLDGKNGFYGNLFGSTEIYFGRLRTDEKWADIAGGSHDSKFLWGRMDFVGAGTGENLFVFNENARNCIARGGPVNAPDVVNVSAVYFNPSTGCVFEAEVMNLPKMTAPPVNFSNPVSTVSGDEAQPFTHDNVFRGGRVYAPVASRFVVGLTGGGENKRNSVERVKFYGTPTVDAIRLESVGGIIDGVYCEHGSLMLTAGAAGLAVTDSYFGDGVVYSGVTHQQVSLSGLDSVSWRAFRALALDLWPNDTSSTTTAGADLVAPIVIPANTIVAGDIMLVTVRGRLTGTAGTKTVQITDDTGTLFSKAFAAADTGAFVLEGEIAVSTTAIYTYSFGAGANGVIEARAGGRRTGLNLPTNGRTLTLERWVANAADSIIVDRITFTPIRKGHAAAA